MRKKRTKKKEINIEIRLSLIAITLVICTLTLTLQARSYGLKALEHEYILKEEKLLKELDNEKKRSEELEEMKIYIQTKGYIEKMARENLSLTKPDEIIIKTRKE